MSNPASKDELNALHAEVAKALTAMVKNPERTAAEVQAAIKFLQNNRIEALAKPGTPLGDLAAAMPFPVAPVDDFGEDCTFPTH